MKIPWIVYAAVGAEVLPLVAAASRRRLLTGPRRWVLAWCAFLFVANLLALALALQNRNNHWLNNFATPVAWGIVLWALSFWQGSPLAALWLRLMIPILWITWVIIVLTIEDLTTFSLLAEPFAGLLVLGGALYTLVSGALREPGDLVQQDWFWVAIGIALSSASSVALPPASYWLVTRHPELVVRAYEVKAFVEILAFLAVARGMLCPVPASRPLRPFSRASSRLPSSRPAS